MSIIIQHRLVCDYCGKSCAVKDTSANVPTGWQEHDATGMGNYVHCCWWAECLVKFKEEHPEATVENVMRPRRSKANP